MVEQVVSFLYNTCKYCYEYLPKEGKNVKTIGSVFSDVAANDLIAATAPVSLSYAPSGRNSSESFFLSSGRSPVLLQLEAPAVGREKLSLAQASPNSIENHDIA